MALIFWPTDLLVPRRFRPKKLAATQVGNPSMAGISQRSASSAGRWSLPLRGIAVGTAENIKLWAAIEGLAQGQLGQIIYAIDELDRGPTPGYTTAPSYTGAFLERDVCLGLTKNHNADLHADADAGATRVTINFTSGDVAEIGDYFSIGVSLYNIIRIDAELSATRLRYDIWPPLRRAVFADDICDFTRPKCMVRLGSDDAMGMGDGLDYGRWGYADLDLIEDTSAPPDGPDLLSVGDFATDTVWTKGANWTISGGKASKTSGASNTITQPVTVYPGGRYRVDYTVDSISGSLIAPQFTGGSTVSGTSVTTSGAKSAVLTAVTGNTTFGFTGATTTACTIDNVSLVQVY